MASEKATITKDSTAASSKSAADTMSNRLSSARDTASGQLEEARLTAEQQWQKAQKAWQSATGDNRSTAQKQWDNAQVRAVQVDLQSADAEFCNMVVRRAS